MKKLFITGVALVMLFSTPPAYAAVIGSQTASSTPIRTDISSVSTNFPIPDFLGILKSFDMYVAFDGCTTGYDCKNTSKTDVEGTYNQIFFKLNCAVSSGEDEALFYKAEYPSIPFSNTNPSQTPVLTRFIWVPGSAAGRLSYNVIGSADYPTASCSSGNMSLTLRDSGDLFPSFATLNTLGNSSGSPYFVAYDTLGTPPTLTAVSVSSNNASTTLAKAGDTVTLTFTADEAVQTPVVTIAGQTVSAATTSGNSFTAGYTLSGSEAEGTLPFTILATSLLGDTGSTVSDGSAVTFDKTAPTITITSGPAGGSVASSSPTNFAFTIDADATSTCAFDGAATSTCNDSVSQALADGAHTFAIIATDHAGNTTSTTTDFTVDTTPPTLSIAAGPSEGSTITTSSVSFTFTTDAASAQCSYDGAATTTCSSPFATTSPDGSHTFALSATDTAGNTSYLSRSFTVNTVPPPPPPPGGGGGGNGPPVENHSEGLPQGVVLGEQTKAVEHASERAKEIIRKIEPPAAPKSSPKPPRASAPSPKATEEQNAPAKHESEPSREVSKSSSGFIPMAQAAGGQGAAVATAGGDFSSLWLLLLIPAAGGLWLGGRKFFRYTIGR